jgi:sulfite reductase alpha subunit-like flavoprotein
MEEATERSAEGPSKSTDKLENREKYPKKLRLAQKLEANPHNVVQRVLDTQVQIPLKTLISNMPEVKKRLFQASYTSEEFDGLSVALLQHIDNSSHKEDSEDEQPRIGAGVNSLLVVMPNYVLVEAEQGVIKEYITIRAEH